MNFEKALRNREYFFEKIKKTLEYLGKTSDNNRETETMVIITNSKQRRTLERIFETPAPKDVYWDDVVSLFKHLGYKEIQGSGSRVRFQQEEHPTFKMHRPHRSKHVAPETIIDIKCHMAKIGVKP